MPTRALLILTTTLMPKASDENSGRKAHKAFCIPWFDTPQANAWPPFARDY